MFNLWYRKYAVTDDDGYEERVHWQGSKSSECSGLTQAQDKERTSVGIRTADRQICHFRRQLRWVQDILFSLSSNRLGSHGDPGVYLAVGTRTIASSSTPIRLGSST
jgi:hypothetical protein